MSNSLLQKLQVHRFSEFSAGCKISLTIMRKGSRYPVLVETRKGECKQFMVHVLKSLPSNLIGTGATHLSESYRRE